ncbi:MAG: adenylate/guanylate cyclase domain-containing protein [Saprospiraceae bacterium]
MRPKSKRFLLKVLPFGLISMLSSMVYGLLEKGILGDALIYPATGNPYKFNLALPMVLTLITGTLIGTFELLVLSKWFQKNSFLSKILLKTTINVALISFYLLAITIIGNAYELEASIFDKEVWYNATRFFTSFAFFTIQLYIAVGLAIAIFYTEVSDNIGQEDLISLFTGKYHRPTEEDRIFMFLDMRSSTTIAEKLGHVRYFDMLKQYYADMSDAIIEHGGEVYQYVGDEVVVTWKLKNGLRHNNCLRCFFAMKDALKNRTDEYVSEFGLAPTFKAGLHLGRVTTGEIGVIKKAIAFSGDVLNTTARIQSLCNEYGVDLLASKQMIDALNLGEEFNEQELGERELRGRKELIKICTVAVQR